MVFGVHKMVLFSLLISGYPVLGVLWSPKKDWESIMFWLVFIFFLGHTLCLPRLYGPGHSHFIIYLIFCTGRQSHPHSAQADSYTHTLHRQAVIHTLCTGRQ